MKKILLALGMAMLMVLTAACGSNTAGSAADNNAASTQTENIGNHKILVVYFSGTGHTRTAAETIAETAHADIFELEPQQPYTEADLDYHNPDSRISIERKAEHPHTPLKQDTPNNFDSYDTIFIGYPIWGGKAAWIVDDFIKNNDFTGKTIIPFATSYSSGLGDSAKNLEEMAGNKGNWQEGKIFKRDMTKEQVTNWVKSLHLNE